eukprot:TRINITY_DN37740_c0_g1_i1.p1 TRINITY_DN37740_c0_g1~~TRINITY_DN37740_c0_g1_i1.p1  ORF type:complete len:313 (-),score=104.29 TRINITY_DN37740_c0_g1_i1:76-1014(-)
MEMKSRNSFSMASHKTRIPPYFVLLLLAVALLGFQGFQKFSDKSISYEIISQKDGEIEKLKSELQNERNTLNDVEGKFKELQKRTDMLRTEKARMIKRMNEIEILKNAIEERQLRLQSSMQIKDEQISQLKEQERKAMENKGELQALTDLLERKDDELRKLKSQLITSERFSNREDNETDVSEINHPNREKSSVSTDTISLNNQKNDLQGKLNTSSENMDSKFSEMKVMERFEKEVLGSKLTATDSDTDTQTEIELPEDDDDDKESAENELEDGENLDDTKEMENLENETEERDSAELQGEDIDLLDDEKNK